MTSVERSVADGTRGHHAPLAPRKRPTQARSIAMVDAMLEAATRILAESGLAALNTNAVADIAGVSVGSLYQYFPNRDALLVALMERFETGMQFRMETALRSSDGNLRSDLELLVQTALAHHFDQALVTEILESEEYRLGAAAKPVLADAEAQMSDFIRAFVRKHEATPGGLTEQVAHRMEIVGRTLVDDALRRLDRNPSLPAEIAAVMYACAPVGFWRTAAD